MLILSKTTIFPNTVSKLLEDIVYTIPYSVQVHLNKLECRGKVNLFQ